MIEYLENGDIAAIDGHKFRRDKKTGYYLSTGKIGDRRKRLHVYMWEKYNGKIPKGYHVHHADTNKANNEISNLMLVDGKEHSRIHNTELISEERKKSRRENVINKMIPSATEWHRSEKGREWHKTHYEEMKDKLHMQSTLVCEQCGKEFIGRTSFSRFCSNKCRSAYRRDSGVDDETRKCEWCGKEFVTNKYVKKVTCSPKCRNMYRWHKSDNCGRV